MSNSIAHLGSDSHTVLQCTPHSPTSFGVSLGLGCWVLGIPGEWWLKWLSPPMNSLSVLLEDTELEEAKAEVALWAGTGRSDNLRVDLSTGNTMPYKRWSGYLGAGGGCRLLWPPRRVQFPGCLATIVHLITVDSENENQFPLWCEPGDQMIL